MYNYEFKRINLIDNRYVIVCNLGWTGQHCPPFLFVKGIHVYCAVMTGLLLHTSALGCGTQTTRDIAVVEYILILYLFLLKNLRLLT